MGVYAELTNGRVWYDERGQGELLVLLHGGAVDSRFFDQNVGPLAARFRVLTTDLWGHGRSPDRAGGFSLESFAADVAQLIEGADRGPAHVLGHSIGADVALTIALGRPDLVRRLVLISGGLNEVEVSAAEPAVSEEQIEQTVAFLGANYGAVFPDGEDHFPIVVRKDFEMTSRVRALAAVDVRPVTARTLVMAADDDIVTLEHMLQFYRALPNSELSIVPGTSHFLLQEKPALCNAIVLDFLTNDPVSTVAPVRRSRTDPGS